MARGEGYKGHDELLDVWSSVRSREPGARLVVVGAGTDLERLRGRARELGLGSAAFFAGAVDGPTLAELYRRSLFFVMPSRLEGFGLVFVEAMAAGKACLALAESAPGEIVAAGVTGRLVPPDDPENLSRALVELFSDVDRTRAMGEAARLEYERRFTVREYGRRMAPVLAELAGA
jgi:glycosyltransferase involved in cell wall biosynthesis